VPNSSTICVDANVAVEVISATSESQVNVLWEGWLQSGSILTAPRLIRYELVNVINKSRRAKAISNATAIDMMDAMLNLPIALHDSDSMHLRALVLASRFDLPATYDAHYLALAEELDCEFWTADKRLARATNGAFPRLRLVDA